MPPPHLGHGRIFTGNSRRGGHTDHHSHGFGPKMAAQFNSPPSPTSPIMLSRQQTLPLRARFAEIKEPTFAVVSSAGFMESNRFEKNCNFDS